MLVLGHRGSRSPGPENTALAVRAALAGGARGSEVDVRRTADRELVCIHDPISRSLGRRVLELTARELAAAGIPPLSEVVAASAGGRLVIEVKNDPAEPDFSPVAESAAILVRKLGLLFGSDRRGHSRAADILISSFDPISLDIARSAGWRTGLLTSPGVPVSEGLEYASRAGYQELHAHISMITEPATAVHRAGLKLVAWTITTSAEALALRDLEVDAAICDDPAAMVATLAAA